MVNKVILIGNLGADPKVTSTPGGDTVARFSIATSEAWKDKNGEKQERTEWHRIVAWGRLADICGKYLMQGNPIYLEGKLQTRSWEKEGVTQYTTEVVMKELKMLPSAKGRTADDDAGYGQIPDDDIPF